MSLVTTELTDRVLVATMNRPDALNAFSGALFDALYEVIDDAADDPEVSVLVLTGAGRAFSAGADLAEMGGGAPQPTHGFPGLMRAVIDFPKPFIVAVNGIGVGVGATITGVADLVFMADDARLKCPFSTLGLTAEAASTYTFPRLMGQQQALWFLWSAEWLSAAEAVDAGLALAAVPGDELMPTALEHARKLAALPVASLIATKELVVGPQRKTMHAVVAEENAALGRLVNGPANREAVSAFLEKREPDFSNLD